MDDITDSDNDHDALSFKVVDNSDNNIQQKENAVFEWKDLNISIGDKQILHNITGRIESGQLLAILGASGAGKSTFLNALGGRILSTNHCGCNCKSSKKQQKTINVTGSVAYKHEQFELGSSDAIKNISGYVMQNDILCATSTCKESLLFASKLRSNDSMEKQLDTVNDIIKSLQLENCSNTRINKLSDGELKRTSIGSELVLSPSLILLDEPISGLDSFTALKTFEILKNLTKNQGKQVITTVHQPSSDILNMIDILLILSEGNIVYYGPTKNILEYFRACGYQCHPYTNIADFVIHSVADNSAFFIEKWLHYDKKNINLDFNFDEYDILSPKVNQTASFCKQLTCIISREIQTLVRDPRPSKIRLVQAIIFAVLIGILYWDLPYDIGGLRDRFGAIFFLTVNSSINAIISTIVIFPEQRMLFKKERNSNMYYTTSYILAKFLIHIPEQIIFVFMYQLIVYWMIGLDTPFLELYLSLFLCVTCCASYGMFVGCFANNASEAMQFFPVTVIPFLLFCNFMVSLQQIPPVLRWIQWIDPFRYLIDALCITEYEGQLHNYECVEHLNGDEICEYMYNGDEYLVEIEAGYNWFNSYRSSVYFDWIMLAILLFIIRLLIWIILVKRNGF